MSLVCTTGDSVRLAEYSNEWYWLYVNKSPCTRSAASRAPPPGSWPGTSTTAPMIQDAGVWDDVRRRLRRSEPAVSRAV